MCEYILYICICTYVYTYICMYIERDMCVCI